MSATKEATKSPWGSGLDFEYKLGMTPGALLPIKCPLVQGPDGDCHQELLDYGFRQELGTTMIGVEDGLNLEIYGPAREGVYYQWLVTYTINSMCYSVWMRTFVELHGYLGWVAPLLRAVESQ